MTVAPEAQLVIDVTRAEAEVVIALGGELDLAGAPRLRDVLVEILQEPAIDLAFDLSGLRFIDSTGLGVLVGAHRRLPDGRRLRILRPTASTYRVLELTGLHTTFEVVDPPATT